MKAGHQTTLLHWALVKGYAEGRLRKGDVGPTIHYLYPLKGCWRHSPQSQTVSVSFGKTPNYLKKAVYGQL